MAHETNALRLANEIVTMLEMRGLLIDPTIHEIILRKSEYYMSKTRVEGMNECIDFLKIQVEVATETFNPEETVSL